jgi:putative membrane protein
MNEIFFSLLGCIIGTITGLIPGLHINTVSILLLELNKNNASDLMVLIVSMSIVHTFVDFIPSIYFGAPEDDNFLSVLPGHKFLLKD